MGAKLAYIIVIAVWATTPLAIKVSSQGYSPLAAVTLRFVLASLMGCVLVALASGGSSLKRCHWKAYVIGSIGIFPNMPLVYCATQYISSGLVSVMFATSPLLIGIFSALILRQNLFTPLKLIGFGISLSGLVLISCGQIFREDQNILGMALMLASTMLFSLSNVLLKRLDTTHVDPLEQSLGSMVFALPGLLVTWFYFDSGLPELGVGKSLGAIIYLATVGSLLGFIAFYYVLKHLPIEFVGMVPLITPVLAIMLGIAVAGEEVSLDVCLGAGLILSGLAVYELLPALLKKLRRERNEADSAALGVSQ